MLLLRSMLVIGLALGITGIADAAKGAKKNKKNSTVLGLVKGAEADKDSQEGGTLTVQAKGKKGAPGDEKKITVTKDTKIEKVAAPAKGDKKAQKKTELKGEAAKFSDIASNAQVRITLKSGSDSVAEKVLVLPAKKAKKKKTDA
jgi:hypothetical protein